MKVILLGTAAGGGYPQWNCACTRCVRAGEDTSPARTHDCVAVSADGTDWYLLNAGPDIRGQVLATPELAAGPGPRESPLRGALLTDAELDHTLGLPQLREAAGGLRVHASAAVLHALSAGFPLRDITDAYGGWSWEPAAPEFELGGLRVRTLPVGVKRPKYAHGLEHDGPWVVAYRVEDARTDAAFVYAPCLATWPDGFDAFVAGARYALVDGTFYAADEMSGATTSGAASGVSTEAQRRMGHVPIVDSMPLLRRHPDVRWGYTHLNNTNPVLCTTSAEYAEVRAAGVELPPDHTVLEFS
ncbi:MAG: pyrroloquinoline quinone biosynthesis protein PqqB [Thermocrispum sp.]